MSTRRAAEVMLAGGAESMSNAEHYTTSVRWGERPGNQVLYDRIDRAGSGRSRNGGPARSPG